jgi:hypothetical protein
MSDACGCCTGVEIAVPASEVNPPGLTALNYRVGTYATFFETMVARLTGFTLTLSSPSGSGTETLTPLSALTTRELSDPSLALLDAWAVVADLLSFYQERIANEGYLPTAQQRRSVLELARLIGYRLRPGVAASVKLAFTVASGFAGTIPAGTRAQSIPKAGQNPQFFETSTALDARDTWNALAPRMTRLQLITPAALDQNGIPVVTGADVIDAVYFDGIATNLKPADALFFIFGPDARPAAQPPQQYLRLVADIDAQAAQQRTETALAPPPVGDPTTALKLYREKAPYLFPGSDIAQDVVAILDPVIANIGIAGAAPALLQAAISRIALERGIAVGRGFTRVTPWLTALLQVMQRISLAGLGSVSEPRQPLQLLPAGPATSPLENLVAITSALALAPSRQPPNPLRLPRSVAASFTPQSDIAPRLLAALHPAAAPSLYQAWSAVAAPAGRVEVYAARVKANLFGANWIGPATVTTTQNEAGSATTTAFAEPTISTAWGISFDLRGSFRELPLDATYEQIKPGSWVAIARPAVPAIKIDAAVTFHVVAALRTANLAAGSAPAPGPAPVVGAAAATPPQGSGFAAKVTVLQLDPPWLGELDQTGHAAAIGAAAVLRQTVVYGQSEPLALAEEPLDTDVGGVTIDLADVYDGLEPGRWVVVSGTRTDIPNVTGVQASELAMLGGVSQGAHPPLCIPLPLTSPPFKTWYYTTDADAFGDRLVVGELAEPAVAVNVGGDTVLEPAYYAQMPAPEMQNQQFCEQAELAPGVYANAYVPTQAELQGHFPTFAGLLYDPQNQNQPFANGTIPEDSIKQGLFAWRISTQALHTILSLASPLAYSYDRANVTIYGNVVDATQGQSTGAVLGNGDATVAFPSFTLSQSPLTYVSAVTPSGASSTLLVQVNELEWNEVDDLAGATPNEHCYVASEDDAQTTTVTFGNGAHGARLPTGTANVKATYRYGMGSSGNVDAGQISQLASHPLGAQGVVNPLPASGGADPDRIDQARANAPIAVMALDRLVSVQDYADFARAYAGIGKAVSARLSDGRRQLVHVTIAGADDIPIDTGSDLFNNLVQSLQQYGDPYLPIAVAIRRVRLIVMAATVGLAPDYLWEDVAPNLRAAILALFAFDARALGQTAFLSEAIAAAQQVEGVAWLNVTTFDGVPESITAAQLAALGGTLGLYPHIEAELAQVDTQAPPGSPGRIVPTEMVFMTPDIPDMLILSPAQG